MVAAKLELEAVPPQPYQRLLEVGDDNRQMAAGGRRRPSRRHQVHLGAVALEPGELGQSRRRVDPDEAEQLK